MICAEVIFSDKSCQLLLLLLISYKRRWSCLLLSPSLLYRDSLPTSDMSSLLRTVSRTPIRQLQQQRALPRCSIGNTGTKTLSHLLQISRSHPIPSSRSSFSAMATLRSNAPAMTGSRDFDPEIKDMANYVHNYKIDSDLAVCEDLYQVF